MGTFWTTAQPPLYIHGNRRRMENKSLQSNLLRCLWAINRWDSNIFLLDNCILLLCQQIIGWSVLKDSSAWRQDLESENIIILFSLFALKPGAMHRFQQFKLSCVCVDFWYCYCGHLKILWIILDILLLYIYILECTLAPFPSTPVHKAFLYLTPTFHEEKNPNSI